MKKVKTEPVVTDDNEVVIKEETPYEETYDDKLRNVNAIAKPIAYKKLAKKCYKLIKKASKHKNFLRNGLKDVQLKIRKGESGIVIIAGDVNPIDIMCHLPAYCEEKGIPYIYTPSRRDLGAALGYKRSTIVVLVRQNDEYKELYNELKYEIGQLPIPA